MDLAAVAAAAADSVRPAAEAKSIAIEQLAPEPDRPVPARGADRLGRRRPAPAGRLEPADQRRQVHPRRGPGARRPRLGPLRPAGPARGAAPRARSDRRQPTTARGSPRPSCRTCSTASARPTPPPPAATAGWAWGWRSSSTSSNCTAGSVWATSEGPAAGSTFTVELPARAARDRPGCPGPKAPAHPPPPAPAAATTAAGPGPARADASWSWTTSPTPANWPGASSARPARHVAAGRRRRRSVAAAARPPAPTSWSATSACPAATATASARAIRALPPAQGGRTPAVALTAFAGEEDARQALAAGYHAHLPKPAEAADLVAAVARLAGRGGTLAGGMPGMPGPAGPAGPTHPETNLINLTRRERLGLDD